MSADFLTTLAARTLGLTPVIQPAIASLFAPQSSMIEESRGQMAEGRGENSLIMPETSSLVSSGNSLSAISRLPYSQILAAASETVTPQGLPLNDSQLQTEENAIAFSTQISNTADNLQLSTNSQNPLASSAAASIVSNNQSNLIPFISTQGIVQRQVDGATPSPSLPLERSESVTPTVEPLINQIDLQPQGINQQNFASQSQEFLNSQEQSNFQQQNINTEIFTPAMEVSQSESTASSPVVVPANAVTSVVSSPENQQPLVSQREDNRDFQPSPSIASPPSVVPVHTVTPVISPLENQQALISPREDDSATFAANLTTSESNLSLAVTPVVSSLEHQQPFVSQREDNRDFQPSPSITSPPSVVPANTVTPVISPLENQQAFVSPRQDDSATFTANPTTSESNLSFAVTPVVSPLENQQASILPRQDDSATFTANPTTSESNLSLAVTPIVSSLENRQTFVSQREDNRDFQPSPSKVSPSSVVPAHAVTPVVSSLENQQASISPRQDDSATFAANPTTSESNVSLTVTPVISPLENQQSLVSPRQDDSATFTANPTTSESNVSLTVTSVISSLENRQSFVSQREDNQDFQPSPSIASPPSVVPANAVTPVISPVKNQQALVSPRQDESGTIASVVAVSESQRVTGALLEMPQTQHSSQVNTAMPLSVTPTPEQQSSANLKFSRQPQINQTVTTPLVDRRIPKSDRYLKFGELQTRLPSEIIISQNGTKIKPLVVMSPERSLDLENDTQLTSKQGLGKNTSSSAPPTVTVTIGRIEVRSTPTPTTPTTKKSSSPQPSVSLQDYLKQRQGGKP